MANKLILKRSSVAAKVPLTTDLEIGELAVNLADAKLYTKNSGGTVIELGGGGGGISDGDKGDITVSSSGSVWTIDSGVISTTKLGGDITTAGKALLDDATAAAQRTTLGATTLGSNLFTIANPSAITFPRFNADNTVSSLSATDFRTAIGAGTGNGTVTSVTGTSPVASSGGGTPVISLSANYGDTLNPYASKTAKFVLAAPNAANGVPTFRAIVASDIPTLNQNTTGTAANVTGTVAVANGGTGATTISGVVIGNGTSAFTSKTNPTGAFVGTTDTQTLTNKTINGTNNTITNVSLTTGVTGTLPVAGGGTGSTTLTANNVLLGNGTSALQVVAPGTSSNILTSNGTTWQSSAPIGVGLGQTYTNVTSSRTSGTTYTNSTGKPITVIASTINSGSTSRSLQGTVAGTMVASASIGSTVGSGAVSITFIVPNGATYSITYTNVSTIFELR